MVIKKDLDISNFNLNKDDIQIISRRSARLIMRYFLLNYSRQGSESSNQFVAWKERKDKNNKKPLLYKTGSMKSNFITNIRKDGFEIKNKKDYFKYHQNGTENLVQREMLYHNNETDKIVMNEIDTYLMNKLGF